MEYINNKNYNYIMNKYHFQDRPFNSFRRFIRNDEIFDESTGMNGEDILAGIEEQDKRIETFSHPVRKAKALEYVLKNTRISCDIRDRFPAINMIDRPLYSTIMLKWQKEIFDGVLSNVEKRRVELWENGIADMYPDYDHSMPIWERIFEFGFKGLLDDSENCRKKLQDANKCDEEVTAFFDGIKITYEAIIKFVERLSDLAETSGSYRMAKALKNIANREPRTFYEGLLTDYLYFIISEHIDCIQVRSLSNFDRCFYKFYKNDLMNGVTEEEIQTDLAYFFLQFTAIGNYWNQPVYLGGTKEDGTSEINELSYIFLDVYDKMGIYNPKVQIKFSEKTPKPIILKALDMIRRGNNCIVFVGEESIAKSLINSGASEEQARMCHITGCYGFSLQGSFDTTVCSLNLVKPLEFLLHKGYDAISGKFLGLECLDVEKYTTFDLLYNEYKRQLKYVLGECMSLANDFENYNDYVSPQSMLSATFPSCLEKGKSALAGGGITNNTIMSVGFLADIADSLAMLKKYVYDRQELTLKEFCEILDKNYEGYEKFRLKLWNDPEKYGNNKDLPDSIAVDIVNMLVDIVVGAPNAKERGGKWILDLHVARASYTQGAITAATPNGRLKGMELSKNVSSSMGQNREGATAAILSATKIDASKFTGSACLDMGLLPSAVKGDDGLEAMYTLVSTFVKRGGQAIHINVFDADTLRAAQKEPEKYSDLQIRVCGWNVLFNNINKEEQDGFIRQAESLV